MAASTLLHGPQGSGKALIATQLARHLGLHMVVDPICHDPRRIWPAEGVLLVADAPEVVIGFAGKQIHVTAARELLGLPPL